MIRRVCLLVLGLVAAALAVLPATASSRNDDPGVAANQHLRDDARGRTTVHRDGSGRLTFVGTTPGAVLLPPGVSGSDSVRAAARAQLDRYGAALGAAPGTSFDDAGITRDSSGVDVVRFQQSVSGVPVLGGQVVLGLGQGRGLRSLQARVAPAVTVADARIPTDQAERTALGVVQRDHRGDQLAVTDLGRWILDPATAGTSLPGGARTVRRLEVGDGSGVRQLVLVDDQTGAVLFRSDLIEHLDRVICDRNNVRGSETPCTTGFARTEGSGPSAVTDVNNAFDFAGATSDFYASIDPGIDLTTMLGVDVGGGNKKLASTVRFCTTSLSDACPFANAFWDGTQMYYGAGYAAADDVVGHEMTHGVIDHYSALFYWGQSGAINESLADVMGEIIDHRTPTPGDSPTNWDLGEDLPGGPLRNMADPTLHGQPDTMTSSLYTSDSTGAYPYGDSGGVHTDSGVGTKTAYLISQGGTFNGQTITGIDAGDPSLTKTATLYLDVIRTLSSGSDYADLGRTLEQDCSDLVTAGTAGFTAADCAAVHQATLATELATVPPAAAHAADAPTSCASGQVKRVLFDSEAGNDPASYWQAGSLWQRPTAAGVGNAVSGTSWYGADPATANTSSLVLQSGVSLPPGQPSYLSFKNWYVLDYDPTTNPDLYYDGGTVEVGVDGAPATAVTTGWINGPDRTLVGSTGAGEPAYSGDSLGWATSRLDLSQYAGSSVRPQFTMRSDSAYGFMGWYLDNITIYTCDPPPPPPPAVPSAPTQPYSQAVSPGNANAPLGQYFAWSLPSSNPGAVSAYRVEVAGLPTRTTSSRWVTVRGLAQGKSALLSVRSLGPNGYVSSATSIRVYGSSLTLTITRSGSKVTFSGYLRGSGHALPGHRVWIEKRVSGGWNYVGSPPMAKGTRAHFTLTVSARAAHYYRVMFPGAGLVAGSYSPTRRG